MKYTSEHRVYPLIDFIISVYVKIKLIFLQSFFVKRLLQIHAVFLSLAFKSDMFNFMWIYHS